MQPQAPVYIVSKGRADSRITMRVLAGMGVPYHVIVEPDEVDAYAAVLDPACLLPLDPGYHARYDPCDTLGTTKSQGPGAARNYAWDHAVAQGHAWHWVMDDNIQRFYRLHRNTKIPLEDGTAFRAMEDWCCRYLTVGMGGPAYEFFAPRKAASPPFRLNTRIYSCNLIRNDMPFRWRGRYNEDTDLSLRLLKAGYCTVQFFAFLQKKAATQTIAGGCNADFYQQEGTRPKSEMLVRLHPDVARLVWRFHRWHHHVDYRRFASNRLIAHPGLSITPGVHEYGLVLRSHA